MSQVCSLKKKKQIHGRETMTFHKRKGLLAESAMSPMCESYTHHLHEKGQKQRPR